MEQAFLKDIFGQKAKCVTMFVLYPLFLVN